MATTENTISDSFKSIKGFSTGLYKEFGSKFIALAYPVTSQQEIKFILTEVKKGYFDARHHCYAYRLGYKGDIWRMNDDGEPSSTAGKPIYGQLLSNSLSDILVVVVRYFGGTKLGVPGLIKAYKTATADAIANAEIVTKVATERFKLQFGYVDMNDVMKLLKEFGLQPLNPVYDSVCTMEVDVRLGAIASWRERAESYILSATSNGRHGEYGEYLSGSGK